MKRKDNKDEQLESNSPYLSNKSCLLPKLLALKFSTYQGSPLQLLLEKVLQ